MSKDSKIALYLTSLMSSALRGTRADDIPKGVSWPEVFEAAGWNSITGLTWSAVSPLSSVPSEIRGKWRDSAHSTALRRIQFDAERELITARLIERGVDVLPLKGAEIASLYPSPEMRSMYDNDILFGFAKLGSDGLWHSCGDDRAARLREMERAREIVFEVMGELGYSGGNRKPIESCHDTKFAKAPFLVFEMHHALMDVRVIDDDYYSDPWRFARLRDACQDGGGGKGRLFAFPPEETYFYSVAHSYKHSIYGYIGLRALADEWVLLSAYSDSMDWGRVEALLCGAGITDYEASLRGLTKRVFEGGELGDNDLQELTHMMKAGTYGAPDDYLRSEMQRRRQSGKRFPRISILMTTLSPDNAPKVGTLASIAGSSLLRPLYPVAKTVALLGKAMKKPKAVGAQIMTLIKGPEEKEK